MRFRLSVFVFLLIFSCGPDNPTLISYLPTGIYGDNILLPTKTEYTHRDNSMQASLPAGKTTKVVLTAQTNITPSGIWSYALGTEVNWDIGTYIPAQSSQLFVSQKEGVNCDLHMQFDRGTYKVDYYENGSKTPSSTKTFTVNY